VARGGSRGLGPRVERETGRLLADSSSVHESAVVAGVKVTLRDTVTISGPISEYGEKGDRKKSMPIKRVEGALSKQFAEAVAEAF
jgi:hypothetical protein